MTTSSRTARYVKTFTMYVVPVLVAGGLVAFFSLRAYGVLPRLGVGPGFALVDQSGQTVTSEDLRGSIVVYSFDSAGCGGCDVTHETLQAVQTRLVELDLPPEAPVEFVTISTAPEPGAAARLAGVAAASGPVETTWRTLTGDAAALKTLVGHGFEVAYEELPDGSLRFAAAIIVVDDRGIVRAEYRDELPTTSQLERAVESVVNEATSAGVSGMVYGAAHLFGCTGTAR